MRNYTFIYKFRVQFAFISAFVSSYLLSLPVLSYVEKDYLLASGFLSCGLLIICWIIGWNFV
jgi:hypothetical protein